MLRMTVLDGKDKGEVFVSKEASVSLGTASDNDIQLTDPFVSRRHGRFSLIAGGWFYRDLGSSNGSAIRRAGGEIALNQDSPEAEIRAGDLLLLGQTVVRFEVAETMGEAVERTAIASRGIAELLAAGERQLASPDGLAAAYQFERQVGLTFDPEQTLDAILAAILGEFPQATHAIILLLDKKTGRPKRQVARVRGEPGRSESELPLSMSVVTRVLSEGRSLLFRDVAAEFADSASAAAAKIDSSVCAPLWTGDETVGMIQVDSRGRGAAFTERDLDRLGLVASRAALAIVGSELQGAEQRNRLLQDLSAMITHDLKGPLTSVIGFLDLLSREPLQDQQNEFVQIALSSSKWLSVLIAGILDVAKMEAADVALDRAPLEISAEIQWVLSFIGYQLREKDISLDLSIAPALPPVSADRELFRRIILNLVGNAVKFSPRKGRLQLTAAVGGERDCIVFSVADEGPGISREHQALIFDKFVQVAGGKSAEQISVGLGLAFCRLAVDAHGGSIWVESERGKGSTFSFSLPLS